MGNAAEISEQEETVDHSVDPLFEPIKIKSLALKNRIVMPAMGHGKARGGVLGPSFHRYYQMRAEAGTSLLIGEASAIGDPVAPVEPDQTHFHSLWPLTDWKQIAKVVHEAGAKIIPQLWHVGMIRKSRAWPFYHLPSRGPSGLYIQPTDGTPMKEPVQQSEPMTQADIDDVIAIYGQGAEDAQRLGFDGLEIHAAHGYLIDQFFWHITNRRTDGYGGKTLRERSRFAAEVVRECRRRTSPDFPIFFRYSQWKIQDYGAKLAETQQELAGLVESLVDAGVDCFHASTRRFWAPEFEGSDMNLAGWTKKISGLPTITVGSISLDKELVPYTIRRQVKDEKAKLTTITNLNRLMEMFNRGDFDMIGVGRAMLSNPDWTKLVRAGRQDLLQAYDADSLAKSTDFPDLAPPPSRGH